jgi:ubiquinone biosynthesis protein
MSATALVAPTPTLTERLIGGPEGLRRLLERLGPTFIKVGQFLALRPDLIPREYTEELLRLLDDVEPFDWAEAATIIEQDLGDPATVFRFINPRPTAAGSIAQVHLADLFDGTRVAVKVVRPGIADRVRIDLRRARVIARLLRLARVDLIASPRELVAELESWLLREIDLRNELDNISRLRRLARNSTTQVIPKAYPEFSSARVLTAEYIQGIPLNEILRALDSGGEREIRRRGWEIDLEVLAENLIEATLRQIFRYRFFHADVHPGNLIVLPNSTIGYIDFGLCEEIDENIRGEQVQYLTTLYTGDVQRMFRALLDVLVPSEYADVDGFRADFVAETTKWLSRLDEVTGNGAAERRGPGTRKSDSPITQLMVAVMRSARRHRFIVPARLLAMYRTLLTAETIASRLSRNVNLRTVGREFFVSLQVDDALEKLTPDSLRIAFPQVLTLLRDSPTRLNQLLAELTDGHFTLRVDLADDPRTTRAKNRRTRLLTTAILSVGVASLIGGVSALPTLGVVPIRGILLVVLLLLYASIWIQWRAMR